MEACKMLKHTLVISRLDYANALTIWSLVILIVKVPVGAP